MAYVTDRRIILYPSYIDSTQTVAEGRLLSKQDACPEPDVMEILESCRKLNLPSVPEDKQYSRAWWIRGRVRVAIKNPDGTPINPAISTKRQLMAQVAALIKQNPNRQRRKTVMSVAAVAAAQASLTGGAGGSGSGGAAAGSGPSASGAASSSKAGGGSNKKKKGKK